MERVKDLKDACLQAANDGIDTLLQYLEETYESQALEGSGSDDIYSLWNKSSLNEDALIENAAAFSAAIGFQVPRHQFVDVIETINRLVATTFASLFSSEFMEELIDSTDDVVKPIIIKALANLSWKEFNDARLSATPQASSLFVKYYDFAMQYVGRALTILRANLTDYPTFETYGYEAPYENSDDEAEEGGFFIGGLTA
jgi:hypothetical protein